MKTATEMSRLVLEMRDNSQNGLQNKRKLELLAEHFLRITGQDREGIDDITHSDTCSAGHEIIWQSEKIKATMLPF